MSNGLYRLEAFGINNVWVRWRIREGGLDEPELESRREREQVYEDDFGSPESLALALQYFDVNLAEPTRRRFWGGK
jgi:hypothetical protein